MPLAQFANALSKSCPANRSAFDSGMQKDELTMFHPGCYSYLVPRVQSKLVVCRKFRVGVWKLAAKLLRNAFPVMK